MKTQSGLLLLLASSGCMLLASGQFLPAQSHLGRLVQSITSPLVITSGGAYRDMAELAAPGYLQQQQQQQQQQAPTAPAGYYHTESGELVAPGYQPYSEASRHENQMAAYYQNQRNPPSSIGRQPQQQQLHLQQGPEQVRGASPSHHYYQQQQQHQQPQQQQYQPQQQRAQLQQARHLQPMQYQPEALGSRRYRQQEQEAAGESYPQPQPQAQAQQEPRYRQLHNPAADSGSDEDGSAEPQPNAASERGAASNHKNQQEADSFQMGAYNGPTIDDQEIASAFNSNNDERDDDDGASAFPGAPSAAAGEGSGDAEAWPRQKAASSASPSSSSGYAGADGYGPPAGFRPAAAAYDEEGADEDEGPAPRRPRPSGSPAAAAAAAHFGGQRGVAAADAGHSPEEAAGNMLAAAQTNGQMPFGYAAGGPIDLSGLMGGAQSAGYQIYPIQEAGYGPMAYGNQQRQQGRQRAAAASSNAYDGFDNPQDGFSSKGGDNDEIDNDDD